MPNKTSRTSELRASDEKFLMIERSTPMPRTSHTPGPRETVEGHSECGCLVLTRKGDNNFYYIEHCTIHNAAPVLLEAAQTAYGISLERYRSGVRPWTVRDQAVHVALREAIRQATGEE